MVEVKKIDKNIWEIEKTPEMKTFARVYASEFLLNLIQKDKTLEQIKNVACLKGIVGGAYAMPDAHQGYGFPIGGVAAFDLKEGIISPGGVGYDINCGVRLISTNLTLKQLESIKKELLHEIAKEVPTGVGKKGKFNLTLSELKEVLETGSSWAIKKGYGETKELEKTEDNGCLKEANSDFVSKRAISRGLGSLGSLGAGNHFLELQVVEEIHDKETAKKFGIEKEGQVTIMIHTGSRGLGHQVASDYIKLMEEAMDETEKKELPDRELIYAKIDSKLGQEYYKAMCCAANFAFANRQIISHLIKNSFKKFIPETNFNLVYDVAHNIAKFEEHTINGEKKMVCIHRKGATRSFGPNKKELPECYQETGQPIIIPGSMGTNSYILAGTKQSEKISFASTAHGAGRLLSRMKAKQMIKGADVKKGLEIQKIDIETQNIEALSEEAPEAYKDIDEVVKISNQLGIGRIIAKLKPIGIIKG
jgi:tRNA-splicing ligase RtcB (3'-phosphate/5'-hydroxy nucleic acid ligase)